MSACFYNLTGAMAGVDMHTYVALGPLGAPVPMPMYPHAVATVFGGPCWDLKKRTATVHADGKEMIQQGFKCALVPHVPFPGPPPHPTEPAALGATILLSSSKAAISVSTVSGEGTSLACCISGPVGLNANCGMTGGPVYNANTVITSPTAADFAAAAGTWVIEETLGGIAGEMIPKIDNPLAKGLVKKAAKDLMKKFIKPAIDNAKAKASR